MFCPQCKAEYRPGYRRCADCDIDLVDELSRFLIVICLLGMTAACTPRPATPSPDEMSTAVAALAFTFLTRTAAAASPTPTITATPPPTEKPTKNVTATPEHRLPITVNFAACYYGPGPTFTLESNISQGKRVQLLGVGSVPG